MAKSRKRQNKKKHRNSKRRLTSRHQQHGNSRRGGGYTEYEKNGVVDEWIDKISREPGAAVDHNDPGQVKDFSLFFRQKIGELPCKRHYVRAFFGKMPERIYGSDVDGWAAQIDEWGFPLITNC